MIFEEQYNTFHKYGYVVDPSTSEGYNYVGNLDRMKETNGILVCNIPQHEQKKRKIEKKKTAKENQDEGDEVDRTEDENPASDAWLLKNMNNPWAGKEGRAARGVDRGARRSTQRRRIRREGIATRRGLRR